MTGILERIADSTRRRVAAAREARSLEELRQAAAGRPAFLRPAVPLFRFALRGLSGARRGILRLARQRRGLRPVPGRRAVLRPCCVHRLRVRPLRQRHA